MPIKLIALDMDGTLLNPEGKITPRTVRALKAARERGTVVTLSSGRMPCALRPFVKELGIDAPLICYNGALTVSSRTEEPLSSTPLSAELGREIARACEDMDLHIQAYRGEVFVTEAHEQFTQDYVDFLRGMGGVEITGRPLSECLDYETPKMLAIDTPERIAELLPALKERFEGRVRVATSQPRFIEFVNPAVGKATALSQLSRLLGIAQSETAAFGDGLNDLDMITWAGTGYVMANGAQAMLDAADEIVPSNAEDGVAQTVEALIREDRLGREG